MNNSYTSYTNVILIITPKLYYAIRNVPEEKLAEELFGDYYDRIAAAIAFKSNVLYRVKAEYTCAKKHGLIPSKDSKEEWRRKPFADVADFSKDSEGECFLGVTWRKDLLEYINSGRTPGVFKRIDRVKEWDVFEVKYPI